MHRETVPVTGGASYIGSHTCVELLDADYDVASMATTGIRSMRPGCVTMFTLSTSV